MPPKLLGSKQSYHKNIFALISLNLHNHHSNTHVHSSVTIAYERPIGLKKMDKKAIDQDL
jgi:hypothetical protein